MKTSYPASRYEMIKRKREKRREMREKWMRRQVELRPPKDPEWFLKFTLPHLGWKLFFKQFGLSEDEVLSIVNAILKDGE